jgi:transcriptional regulator
MAEIFTPSSPADVARLLADFPLAWVISADFQATPLPLVAETDTSGAIVALIGHFARRNPQVSALQSDPRALILFQGPQGYISPRRVSKPAWGPTWNYAVARFEVTVEFVPERIDEAIRVLATHLEGGRRDPWTPAEMGPRYADLRRHIISFRAHVRGARATFKLGQDEDAATFAEITASLGATSLAEWMRWQRKPPPGEHG